jgi:hypothetical protein
MIVHSNSCLLFFFFSCGYLYAIFSLVRCCSGNVKFTATGNGTFFFFLLLFCFTFSQSLFSVLDCCFTSTCVRNGDNSPSEWHLKKKMCMCFLSFFFMCASVFVYRVISFPFLTKKKKGEEIAA